MKPNSGVQRCGRWAVSVAGIAGIVGIVGLVGAACGGDSPAESASGSGSASDSQGSSGTAEASASESASGGSSGASASGMTGTTGASATDGTAGTGSSGTSGTTASESSGVVTAGTTAGTTDGTGTTVGSTTDGPECQDDDECPPIVEVCIVPVCDGGACGGEPAMAGTACDQGEGVVCDGEGQCVECLADDECATKLCQLGQCAPAACGDGIKNGDETDVDCGGSCPAKCEDGEGCSGSGDCESGVCTNNECKAPSCSDGLKNGQETDVDCGGSCPSKCEDGDSCEVPMDCVGGICSDNTCDSPSCGDGLKNGQETDVDCGGDCPENCADGEGCSGNSDCESDYCEDGTCKPEPGALCASAPADPETGQKCPLFAQCDTHSDCGVNKDCQLWFCNNQKRCELDALGGCGINSGGGCVADVVISQYSLPPVAKRFVPPDGVDFRELASIAFVVTNNTSKDLFIDEIPLALDTMNGGSTFDVSSTKLFEDSGKNGEHEPGSFFLCVTAKTFQFPANGLMSQCGNLNQTKVPKNGGSEQFIVNIAFAKELGYIKGRSYRLRIPSQVGFKFKEGSVFGPTFAGSKCGVPGGGFTGAWLTAEAFP